MICLHFSNTIQLAAFRKPWLRGLLIGLLICVSPVWVHSQVQIENRLPDPVPADKRGSDVVWDKTPPQVAQPIKILGEQLVTPNQLRAPEKARSAIQKAARAIRDNHTDEAAKQIARALQAYPDYALAFTIRAMTKLSTQPSDAVADLERAIRLDPSAGLPCAILASRYNDAGRYQDALPLALRAVQLLPAAWQTHFEMARALLGRKQTDEALKEVTDAIRLSSSDATSSSEFGAALHFCRGRILVDLHEFADARREFEIALKADPRSSFGQSAGQILARLDTAIH
jgi:tetratricopeptide (TPR) repeat protein